MPPPTVDLIETNIADGLEPLAGVSEELIGVGDRGYGFMLDVFAAEWLRNEHVWNSRDWFYTIGVIGGLAFCALAIYEMNFRRRPGRNSKATFAILGGILILLAGWALLRDIARTSEIVDAVALQGIELEGPGGLRSLLAWWMTGVGAVCCSAAWRSSSASLGDVGLEFGDGRDDNKSNAKGLLVFLAGVAIALLGVWRLHATDSTGANWTAALIIAAGMTVAFLGWGLWRYMGRGGVDDALGAMADSASGLAESGLNRVVKPLLGGVAALVLSVGIALWLNPDNDFDLWPTTTDKLESITAAKVDAFVAIELEPVVAPRVPATVETEFDMIIAPRVAAGVEAELTSLSATARARLTAPQLASITESARSQLGEGELDAITEAIRSKELEAVGDRQRASVTEAVRTALVTAELDSMTEADRQAVFERASLRAETENPLDIVTVTGGRVAVLALIVGAAVAVASQLRNLRRESFASVVQNHALAAVAAVSSVS